MQHLKEGLDPTGLTCITFAELLQMIQNAQPYPKQGFVIFQSTAPNVITNPELVYFIWVKTADDTDYIPVDPVEIYYYNGTSWAEFTKIDGSRILPGTVDLTALKLTAASAYDIIQCRVAGGIKSLVWTSIPSAVQDDTLPPAKLVAPDLTDDYVLTCFAGTKAFQAVATFFGAIDDFIIPITKIAKAAADTIGFYLRSKLDGSGIEWSNVDVANLAAAAGLANQSIRRKSDNSAWEYFTPSESSVPNWANPLKTVYTGAPAAWATVSDAAIKAYLAGKKAVILQGECVWDTHVDGYVTIEVRKDNTNPSIIVNRAGSIDATQGASQCIAPVMDDGSFDYRAVVSSTGAPVVTVTLSIVGFLG